MRTINFIFLSFCLSVFSVQSLSAQIRVEPNGRVQVGAEPVLSNGAVNDPFNMVAMQIFDRQNYLKPPILTFGDSGKQILNSWNVFIGEYGTTDTDQLWLHGKYGTYFTYNNGGAIWGSFDITNFGNIFRFNCSVTSRETFIVSDERLKKDIKPLSGSLSSLLLLEGVSYYLIPEELSKNKREQKDLPDDLTEKEKRDMAFFEEWEKKIENDTDTKLGFLAQDLQKVFPELVMKDSSDYFSVNYIGLIPVIVESIKEQQQIITAQSEKIKELESLLNNSTGKIALRSSTEEETTTDIQSVPSENTTNAFLYQNNPNPFQVKTEIRYYLPEEVKSAEICIFDMQGSLIQRIPADRSGSVEIRAAGLSAGMYLYSLIADGQEVDTKRMILTK